MAKFSAFELDPTSVKELEKFLKEAAALPRKRITHAVKEGGKVAMNHSKEILKSSSHSYEMTFEDGNTWTKEDVIKSLGVKLEKGKRMQRRVVQVGSKDWRIGLYSNFIEYGVPRRGFEALHFMRRGLTETRQQVEDVMLEDLAKSLDKLRSD